MTTYQLFKLKKDVNFSTLNLTDSQKADCLYIMSDLFDPTTFSKVKNWMDQCFNPPTLQETMMAAFDQVLEGYGIESVNGPWKNGYWCDICFTYVNMGDPYALTIICHRDNGFQIACWADLIK